MDKMCLKPKEVAELMGLSAPMVYDLCRRRDFPAIRVGRAILIPAAALEEWLLEQARQG